MTQKFTIDRLVKMMSEDAEVFVIDHETGKTYFNGTVDELIAENYNDEVVDWDFSDGCNIYI